MDSLVTPLIGSFMAVYFLLLLLCPFTAPLAVVLPLVANAAFSIFLGCLFFHPPLHNMIVRADTDSSALDMKAAKKERKTSLIESASKNVVIHRQFPHLDTASS